MGTDHAGKGTSGEQAGQDPHDSSAFLVPEALALLSKSSPFSDLGPELLKGLLSRMHLREYGSGERLIQQGDAGDYILVILSGTAEAFINNSHTTVGKFGPGDVVGEISLLTGERRTADVVSRTPVRSLLLSLTDFHKIADAHPEVRMLLTNVVADRLGRATHDGLGGKDIHGHQIIRCVGRGGMGIVYEAKRLSSGDTVALKMLNHRLLYYPGAVHRFRREADALESLRHESIARLYECFAAYGTQFLVMEFCEGSTVKELLASGHSLPEDTVRKIVGQLAVALRYVHSRGLVHRDVKPSNVMIIRSGGVKLLDFGLVQPDPAWPDEERSEAGTVSHTVTLHGTPRYMAPEQFRRTPVDHRVDLYGLACLAYEALSGGPVVKASDLFEILQEKLAFVLPSPQEIGPGVTMEMHEFIARGLEHRADKRTIDLERVAAWAGPVDWNGLNHRAERPDGALPTETIALAPSSETRGTPPHAKRSGVDGAARN